MSVHAAADAIFLETIATPAGQADPWSRYAVLQETAPFFRSSLGMFVACRYDDCQNVLRDGRFIKDEPARRAHASSLDIDDTLRTEFADHLTRQQSMLWRNPPDHTRLRRLVSKAFTPRRVEELRPHILRLCDSLIDEFDSDASDAIEALAFPLPVTVVGELLGVPEPDRAQFQELVRANTAALEPTVTAAQVRSAIDATNQMRSYFGNLAEERATRPADDLISALLAAEDEGDKLTREELISTCILLFAAGFETTTNLLGNGLSALLNHPSQLQRLRDNPGLARTAVEEMLRWDSPVQLTVRVAAEDLQIAGHDLAAGDQILTLLGAANHDPNRYPAPDTFDIGRDAGAPLSFGAGIHYCLGAALARAEGEVVFTRLLERFGTIELSGGPPVYRPTITLRGLRHLFVRFSV